MEKMRRDVSDWDTRKREGQKRKGQMGRGKEDRERKCADTISTVQLPWDGHFQC